jgi:PD-(D/E)XK endonuclease
MWKREDKPSDWRIRNTRYANTKHTDCKRLGEASEAEFLARAARLFFRLAKPWGESDPYDALVAIGRGFWRVQVKCASSYLRGQYVVKAGGDSHNYTKDDIDFLAAHAIPENIWYIVPIEAFEGKSMLHFCPHGTGKAKYERYREAWCLLKVPLKARGWKDIPVTCRCKKQLPIRCAVCPCRTDTPCGADTSVRRS